MVSCSNALKKTLKTLRWVIRIRKSQNDRQHNGQKKKDNDLQNTTQKNKSSSNTNPTKTRVLRKGKKAVPASLVAPVVLL